MLNKIIRGVVTLIGMILGFVLTNQVLLKQPWLPTLIRHELTQEINVIIYVVIIIIFGIIFYSVFPLCHSRIRKLSAYIEKSLENVRLADIIIACCGLLIGLLIALLVSFVISLIPIPWLSSLLSALVYILLGYLGFNIALHKRDDILNILNGGKDKEAAVVKKPKKRSQAQTKILDTSAIIDGRIYDVLNTGFLEGQVIVPTFVLAELQLLADNADEVKHARGRRGLEILQKMQQDPEIGIIVSDVNYDDLVGVDDKLIRMAKSKKMAIITNDYNLNQVATLQNISVLNVNALSEALRPVVLPGEKMKVMPVKNGREAGQSVAYLEDGTMVVIENGRSAIGKSISVIVTSVLQTAAGRMIFARPV